MARYNSYMANRVTAKPRTIQLNEQAQIALQSILSLMEKKTERPLTYSEMLVEAEKVLRRALTPAYILALTESASQ